MIKIIAFRRRKNQVKLFSKQYTCQLYDHIILLLELLGENIKVYGDWLPRHLFGKGTALFAIIRMINLCLVLLLVERSVDVVLLDGVSAPIPLLQVL